MMSMLSSKKGQFYILIALLLISYAFALSRQDAPIRKSQDGFQLLHEGYIREGSVVINGAVYDGENVSAKLDAFTDSYVAFARSTEPGFRLAYLLRDDGLLAVGNRMGADINVTVGNASHVVPSSSQLLVAFSDASLTLSGIAYDFRFSSEGLQLKAIFMTSDKLAKRVFVKG